MSQVNSNAMLLDEFNVQVFGDGRVHWDRLDQFINRHPPARRRLNVLLGAAATTDRREGAPTQSRRLR